MEKINPESPNVQHRLSRRLIPRLLIAGLAALGVVGLTAVPAYAIRTCTGGAGTPSGQCLWIEGVGNGMYRVIVGIDVFMSHDRAQEYVDDAGDPFRVTICGDDFGGCDEELFDLPLTGLRAATDHLAADFEMTVPGTWLNEDAGQDEIRARIQLIDTDINAIDATFVTGRITGNWP